MSGLAQFISIQTKLLPRQPRYIRLRTLTRLYLQLLPGKPYLRLNFFCRCSAKAVTRIDHHIQTQILRTSESINTLTSCILSTMFFMFDQSKQVQSTLFPLCISATWTHVNHDDGDSQPECWIKLLFK